MVYTLQITALRHTANSQSVLIKLNLKVTPPQISQLKWYDNVPSKHSTSKCCCERWNLQCSKTESGKSCELDDDQIWADIQLPLLISCFIPGYSQEVRSLNTSYHRPTRAARIKSPAICTLFITLQYPDLTWTHHWNRLWEKVLTNWKYVDQHHLEHMVTNQGVSFIVNKVTSHAN